MALKDLATDLSKFKYGLSSPDKVDSQIKDGVDFFDDNEGGATGFTPKAGDLESQYKRFIEGNVVQPPDVSNDKTRSAFGSTSEYNVPEGVGLSNPPHILSDDNILLPREQPQFTSPFMDLPIANYVSQYPKNPSLTWGDSDGTMLGPVDAVEQPQFLSDFMVTPINGALTSFNNPSDSLTLTIERPNLPTEEFNNDLRIPGANGSEFMVTPILGQPTSFSDPSDSLTLTVAKPNQPIENFSNDLRIPGADGSSFMVTPILDYQTSFNDPSDSLTLTVEKPNQPTENFNNDIRIPNANNALDSLSRIISFPDNFSTIPGDRQPSISSEGHEYGTDFETKWPDAAPFNIKQRGVYDEYILGENLSFSNRTIIPIFDESDPPQITDPSRYFNEEGASIHISGDDPKIQAGLEYGALKYINEGKTVQRFELFSQNDPLTDNKAPTDNYPATNLNRIPQTGFGETNYINGLTSFDGKITIGVEVATSESDTLKIPFNTYTGAPNSYFETTVLSFEGNPTTQYVFEDWKTTWKSSNLSNTLGSYVSSENLVLLAADNNPDNITRLESKKIRDPIFDKVLVTIPDKYEISSDTERYGKFSKRGENEFNKVPAGLGENNVPTFKTFREVADPLNIAGFRQPFILRGMGDRWGLDPINSDTGFFGTLAAGADGLLSGFVRGAPTFTGLVERNFADKVRIGKFLLTPQGIGFIAKQFVLQALNPTLESKLWNPLSTLGLPIRALDNPEDVLQPQGFSELATTLAAFALPITHIERHAGGGRYEDVVPLTGLPDFMKTLLPSSIETFADSLPYGTEKLGFGSRLAMQSNPEVIEERTVGAFGFEYTIGGKDLGTSLIFMNPNKYLFPISSAPTSVGKDGISFTGGIDSIAGDVSKIESMGGPKSPDGKTRGGTFNKQTSAYDSNEDGLIKKHSTLAYDRLNKDNSYTAVDRFLSPSEFNEVNSILTSNSNGTSITNDAVNVRTALRRSGSMITRKIGSHSEKMIIESSDLGLSKGSKDSSNVDMINIAPVIHSDESDALPKYITDNPDFVKFMFKDIVNNKYLVFRAILESITDNITPEFGETKFLGRPDKIYNYSGTSREISFNFKIYPKTKQELPVLMEKLNYLVGLCYPSYTKESLMITPFIELTIGNMFTNASGLIGGLSVNVEEASTWEIEDGLQYPHFISCQCEFKYIGGDNNIPVTGGKHYDIGWIADNGFSDIHPTGMYVNEPERTKFNYINSINAVSNPEE